MNPCYLGLGSNLNHPQKQIRQALKAIKNLPRTYLVKESKIYSTSPLGLSCQPFFLNMVILIVTTLPPKQLLKYCQKIEYDQRRIRKKKWGPRTIDIDILIYGELSINLPHLVIPHPHMLNRDFVMQPLQEVLASHHPLAKQTFTYEKSYILDSL